MRGTAFLLAAALLLPWAGAAAQDLKDDEIQADPDAEDAAARGKYVLHAAGCVTCHTADAETAVPLTGGRALKTDFGTFNTPNITPHTGTGIGDWSEADFLRALRRGVAPNGSPYYPTFPYTHYAGMTDADARDLLAYLKTLPSVANDLPAHNLDFPYNVRVTLWPWRWLFFDGTAFTPDPDKPETWNRGAYLVRHLGHCGACHTPRNALGARRQGAALTGNPDGPEGRKVPNITPHETDGIGDWDKTDITFFLKTGFLPDGDVAGGGMSAVIRDSTSHLTDADLDAVATYLLSLPPRPDEPS